MQGTFPRSRIKGILRPGFSSYIITIIQYVFFELAGYSLEFEGCDSSRVERESRELFWSMISAQSVSHT